MEVLQEHWSPEAASVGVPLMRLITDVKGTSSETTQIQQLWGGRNATYKIEDNRCYATAEELLEMVSYYGLILTGPEIMDALCCSGPPLWSSGQSSWLHNGDVLCFLWGTNWICICYVEESRPPLWSSGQSSWLHNGDVLFPVRYELNLYMLCRRK
jgi:hypothetical protein